MSKDILKDLFSQMPIESPSIYFGENLKQLVENEVLLRNRRKTCWSIFGIVVASLIIISAVIFGCATYISKDDLEPILSLFNKLAQIDLHNFKTHMLIGSLVLLLLFGDYWMRSYYFRKRGIGIQ